MNRLIINTIIGVSMYIYVIVVSNTTFTKINEAIVKIAEITKDMIVNMVYCLLFVANLILSTTIKKMRASKMAIVTF